jgi:radical SAM-linked protein
VESFRHLTIFATNFQGISGYAQKFPAKYESYQVYMKTQRWRLTFAKTEAMRFTSHLDLILTWERTFRRSGLPLSYSEGFNPRPVINLAAPLPLGFTSEGEIGDFWLSETVSKTNFSSLLERSLPPGLQIHHVEEINYLHGRKLPSLVQSALYRMTFTQAHPGIQASINSVLAAKSLPRERKGKTYDLRPLIKEISLLSSDTSEFPILGARLSLLPGATGRPDEVLLELGISPLETLICREKILLQPASGIQ